MTIFTAPLKWLANLVMTSVTTVVAKQVSASVTLAEIDTALELTRKARELEETHPELADLLRRKAQGIEGKVLGGDQSEFIDITFEPVTPGNPPPALLCPSEEPPPAEPRRSLPSAHSPKRRGRPPKNRAVESFDIDHNNGHIDTY